MRPLSSFVSAFVAAAFVPSLFAGEPQVVTTQTTTEKVPLDLFEAESTYVFESDLNHGGSFGKQDEVQNRFEYSHRFLLTGQWYLRLGLAYNRFDFGNTTAPVPVHLQSGAGIVALEYMQGEDIGAFLQFRPGFYTEEHLGLSSFDCPIALGRFWILQPGRLYVLTGVYTSFLKGGYPVIPLAGVVWKPSKEWRLMGVLPNPRLIYSPTKQLDLWIGGDLSGGSFRTDHHDEYVGPHIAKLSGTQVDFYDYRVGVGFSYDLTNNISLNGAGGYSIQRHFAYHRAGENYRTDPSPYVQVALKASF